MYYADNLEIKAPKSCSPYLTAKIPMLLRILYGCGTRLGETLALRRKDIDFENQTIFFRETKRKKERLIPTHDSLMNTLEKYCSVLGITGLPDAYLFPGATHKGDSHLTKRQAATWFTEILRLANIDQREKSRS
jgi:integrase